MIVIFEIHNKYFKRARQSLASASFVRSGCLELQSFRLFKGHVFFFDLVMRSRLRAVAAVFSFSVSVPGMDGSVCPVVLISGSVFETSVPASPSLNSTKYIISSKRQTHFLPFSFNSVAFIFARAHSDKYRLNNPHKNSRNRGLG